MSELPVRLRARLTLLRLNLDNVKEYYDEASGHFDRRLQQFLSQDEDKPKSYWEEDVGGMTRGDLAAEERMAIEGDQQMTRQFSLILCYSELERFLIRVCEELP